MLARKRLDLLRRPEVVDREILKLEKELSGQASPKKK
jgi:hypothetical protein